MTADLPASDMVLALAPELVLRLRGDDLVEISVDGHRAVAGMQVLGILEQFARPTSMREFVQRLRAAGVEGFIESTSLVMRLWEQGILVDGARTRELPRVAKGFDAPWAHVAMLDDLVRTRAFVRAIHEVVRPGDVVVDIGTGTGVLAVEAARAGAQRVYAIEEGGIADAAQQVFAVNGVSDRVRLVRGRSTAVDLPERADVLVSEVLGNDPLEEDVLSSVRDARRRLLKPDARLVPRSVDLVALPVDLPLEFLDARSFTDKNVARWGKEHGIDFRPLVGFGTHVANLPNVKPQDAKQWSVVADPLLLARVQLDVVDEALPTRVGTFVARTAASCLGFLLYFEAELAPSVVLSTAPAAAADDNHWSCRVFRANEHPSVIAGDTVRVEFSAATGRSVVRATR